MKRKLFIIPFAFLFLFFLIEFVVATNVGLDWIYPTEDINVSRDNFFNVSINVSCSGGDCGEVNVSLDPASIVYTFTTCGASGRFGPNQNRCNTNYSGTSLAGLVTVGNGTLDNGTQYWTVPTTGVYTIETYGAQGGGPYGGKGAYMKGTFNLNSGTILKIVVGQKGQTYGIISSTNLTSGGGGTYVVNGSYLYPLIISGGGGGASLNIQSVTGGQNGTAGKYGLGGNDNGTAGGTNGFGGIGTSGGGGGGGGGGLYNSATGGSGAGYGFANGSYGGYSGAFPNYLDGGFGGGGASRWNPDQGSFYGGGAGGGYSGGGGACGTGGTLERAGGGGSYNAGTEQNNTAAFNTGDGYVVISFSGKSGLVSINSSATPFYTNVSNPYNLTLNENESQVITWTVNATGEISLRYEFFVYANLTSNMSIGNKTSIINISIIDTNPPIFQTLINQTSEYGIDFNYQINATDVYGVSCFSVNDTINFNINCSGYLKNNTLLDKGLYWINITVNDSSNNRNSALIFVNVSDATGPTFINLTNQTIGQYNSLGYQINANDASGVSCFTVNDSRFDINCSGYLRNITALTEYYYVFNISVNDTYNNLNSQIISVTRSSVARINLDLIYPIGNLNVNQNDWFNVSVNISCFDAYCGDINVSLDPIYGNGINYSMYNSSEVGADSYVWEELITTGIGTAIWNNTEVDEGSSTLNLPFNFSFYGTNYSTVYIVSNGRVDFTSGFVGDYSIALPHSTLKSVVMANQDLKLYLASGGKVFYANRTNPSRFVVQYYNVSTYGASNTRYSFEAIIYSDGKIKIQYSNVSTTSYSQDDNNGLNFNSTAYLLIGADAPDQYAGKAVTFYPLGYTLTGAKGGLVSINSSATPFYTNVSNPYTVNLNHGQSQVVTWTVNATGTSTTPYTFFAYANMTSNMSIGNITSNWNVTINDIFAPVFTNISNKSLEYKTTLSHTISASDSFGINCYGVNDTKFAISCAGVLTNNTLINVGIYNLNITVNDTSNNMASGVIWVNVSDTLVPVLNITYPINNTNYIVNVSTLNYTVTDSSTLGSCWWSNSSGFWNSSTQTPGINWTGLISLEGWNNWTVYCNDTYNNIGSRTNRFFKDTVLPIFNNISNQSTTEVLGLQYQINATDSNGISCFTVNDTTRFNINCSGYLKNNTILSGGLYNLNITINDTYNNRNSVLMFVNVSDTNVPIFNNLTNQTLYQDVAFNYQINATDVSGVSCFSVNDTINFNINCSGYLKNNTYLNVGLYTLNITVNDSSNNKNYALMWVNVTLVPRISLTLISPTGNINITQNKTFEVSVNVSCSNTNCGEINVTLDPSSTIYNFTTCGVTGRTGPNQTQCNANYTGTTLAGLVTVGGGIQNWTVPFTGTYVIELVGAAGGNGSTNTYRGGYGAKLNGTFSLVAGQTIKILVGQRGTTSSNSAGGGGGGTFVALSDNTPLIVAGGGSGGGGNSNAGPGQNASLTTSGKNGSQGVYTGGINGLGGGAGSGSSGGGGFYGNGTTASSGYSNGGGISFISNGTGGAGGSCAGGNGGFGGGSGGEWCSQGASGAGGGYSGGAGTNSNGIAGSGGSFNNGTIQSSSISSILGDGYVTITYSGGKEGTVSMSSSATPFYTTTTNPYNLILNNGQSQIITWTVNATGTIGESYTFFAYTNKTSDLSIGNITRTWNVTITNDTGSVPIVSIIYPQNINYNFNINQLNYTVTGNNLSRCWYSKDGGVINSSDVQNGTNFNDIISIEGSNTWTVYCNNTNSSIGSSLVNFNVDLGYPNVSLISPADSYSATIVGLSNISFNCSASDNLALKNISLYITNSSNTNFLLNKTANITGTSNTTNWTLSLGAGNYTWNCLAYDSLGNSNWSVNRTISLQSNIAPNVSLISPFNNSLLNRRDSILLNANISDYNGYLDNFTVWFYGGYANGTYSLINVSYNQTNGNIIVFNWTLGSSGRYNWTVIANDGKANSTNYYFYFNLTNFSVSCEAGGNYQQGALVLVQGTIKNESIVVPSYSINLSIYDSGNNRDAYQNLTTANDGGFETNFANLSVGSYVLNATAVYRGYNETCQDIFSIGGPASLILDKIVTLQNITNETITYNISLRVTNKGMSDASSVVLTDSDSTDSPYNIENVFANSSFIRSYLKEYIRNSSTYDLAFGIASVNAINSYSGNEISSNSSEITLTVPALEIGQQLNLIKNIYYNSENSTSVNYTVSINVINSGGVDLSSISLIDSDLGLTFTINLNRTQNYSYTSSVVVDKAASNSNKLFVKTSATVNSITYQSNQIQVRIPGYGGPADAIVNAPASISASSSFSTIISVENKNADVGQDFTIDYWITNAKNDDINYSSGQQTIYVAASGSSDLTAVLTSPSTAGNYRFKALVSWAGGTATAYDSFLVASMGTGDGDEGGGSGGNGGGGIGGGSSSSVVAGSITGKITDSVVCNPPYIRYGKECCLDKNNNSICDSDDAEEVQNQTNATSAEGKNENIKTSENNSEQFDNQIVKNFFSGASNLLSKTSNSLFSNNYLLLFLLVALIFIVFIVLFIKFNLINSLIVFYNFIINKSIYRIKDIFYIFKIKQKDPTRLTNILGMDVYSSDGDLIGKVKEVYLENNHPKVYGWLIKVDKKVAKKIGKKFILVKHHLVISIKHVMMVDGRVLEYLENY